MIHADFLGFEVSNGIVQIAFSLSCTPSTIPWVFRQGIKT